MKRIVCILLTTCLMMTTLVSCGQKNESSGEFTGHEATVILPEKTDLEKLADLNSSAAVQAYLIARTYLDDFLDYDIGNGNPDEYRALLDKTILAFEEVNVLSESLKNVCDVWIETEGTAVEKPVLTACLANNMKPSPYKTIAYAAGEDNASVAWAKEITKRFDEAPAGKGIRTLAEHLGTDYKRAYAQLQQAQEILAGAAYEDFADTANEAYKTATYLKTAGTAAGFVIAVAATPAPTAVGAAINTGGAVISGVNTLLEIGSSGALFVTNGEGNWVSEACDKTESQMAPIGAVFSIAGVTTNVAGFMKNTDTIIKDGVKAGQTTKEILTTIGKSKDVAEDAFGMISYTAGSLTELVNDKSVLGGTMKMDENGKVKFTLADTLLGTESSEKQPEIKDVLEKAGLEQSVIEESIKADPAAISKEDTIPETMRDDIRSAAPMLDPGSTEFDQELADSFANSIEEAVENILNETTGDTEKQNTLNESTGAIEEQNTLIETASETEEQSEDEQPQESGVTGNYEMTINREDGLVDVVQAEVTLHQDETMEISFGTHRVWFDDNFQQQLDTSTYGSHEHLVGHYDSASHTFTGIGDVIQDPVTTDGFTMDNTTFWNMYDTVLVFSPDEKSASGVMAEGEALMGISIETQITMKRIDGEKVSKPNAAVLSADKVAGVYRFENTEGSVLEYLFEVTDKGMTIGDTGRVNAYDGTYDENTGVFIREEDGFGMKVTFTETSGKITATLIFYQNDVVSAEYSGEKQ